jgi:hypothetical protein
MGPSFHHQRYRSTRLLLGDSARRELLPHIRRTDAKGTRLSPIRLMGLVSLGCTMLAGRIALWDLAFLIESNRLCLFRGKLLNLRQFHA